ncbi:MAG: hypothetical protein IT323_06665 [Anaerolineae bacterium]|nr:hypothetical protein [Anaerolineae bacterium]
MEEVAAVSPIYGGIHCDRLEGDGLQCPCPTRDHPGTPILHTVKFLHGLGRFTPAHFQPPAEIIDDHYPFVLTTGHILQHWDTGSMTRCVNGLKSWPRKSGWR